MNDKQSSYEFHCSLESPREFFARERKTAALCTLAFALITSAAALWLDPAFFYPRLQTDPLNYYLKAKALVETGSTDATWAVNLKPFAYQALPGLIRLPAFLFVEDFDSRLRLIQLLNIPIVAAVALLSALILSWALPLERKWMAIVFSFAFTLLSPTWISNIFLPLVDAPYAVVTMLGILLSIDLVCSNESPFRRPFAIAAFALLLVVAFMLRLSAPVLLAYPLVLAVGKWPLSKIPRARLMAVAAATLGLLTILIALNSDAIFNRYILELPPFFRRAHVPEMVLNVAGTAIPSQVVPTFLQGFKHPPIVEQFQTSFHQSAADMAWLAVGMAICSVVVTGMWVSRRKFLPEIFYFLVPLPILSIVMSSTPRYLMTYQAFVWIFSYAGMAVVVERLRGRVPRISRAVVIGGAVTAAVVFVGLRVWRLGGSTSERYYAVNVSSAPRYIADVAGTFRGLRGFLESLPRESTLLIGDRGTAGRWKAISGVDYYAPDSALSTTVNDKNVYLLIECGTAELCQEWSDYRQEMEGRVTKYGQFDFHTVYARDGKRAHVEVLRLSSNTK